MARIIYSALVDSINGSIKGTTFQRNRYGYTIKGKPNMIRPTTQKQQKRKTSFSGAIQAWRSLSDSERAAWNSYATTYPVATRLNPSAYLNGFNYFARYHASLWISNSGTVLADPSGAQGVVGSYQSELVLDTGDLHYLTDLNPTEGPWTVQLYLTRPLLPSQTFVKSWTRLIASYSVTGSIDTDISSLYTALFGQLPSLGQLIGLREVIINTTNGQVFYQPSQIVEVTT
jgi:hypothetical protein